MEGDDMEDDYEAEEAAREALERFMAKHYFANEWVYREKLLEDIEIGDLSYSENLAKMRVVHWIDHKMIARKIVGAVNEWVHNIGGGNMAPARLKLRFAPWCCCNLKEWQSSEDRLLLQGFKDEYGQAVKEMMEPEAGYTEDLMKQILKEADWEGLAARNVGTRSHVECKARFWFGSWALSEKGSRTLRERRAATEEKRMMRLIKRQGGTNTDWPLIAKELGGNRTPDWCFERFVRLKKDAAAEAEAESMKTKKKKRSP